jgi:indole-3-glycerol phosphate synthase
MTILDDIAKYKREEVAAAKARMPITGLEDAARAAPSVRGFRAALEFKKKAGAYGLIAEVKKASPSKGLIRADFDPSLLAHAYERGGAACLSVLTDTPSFQGAPQYLMQAREATALPVLRKDFMLDSYQVTEARAWGADCILIILAMVDDMTAKTLMLDAAHWGMDALVEVHDAAELDRALVLDRALIGINNRNLRTFDVSLATTLDLLPRIPAGRLVVTESGILAPPDVATMREHGVEAFLVGEAFMRAPDPGAALATLFA